jgi:Alpha-L-arabinofuranosidase
MRRSFLSLFLVLLLLPSAGCGETLVCDPSAPVHEISDTLYGLFFEDINHAADGGLYAELLQNRSFEYEELLNPQNHQHYTGWVFNALSGGEGKAEICRENPLNDNNPTFVRIRAEAGYTFQNLGYGDSAFRGGIPVRKGENYDLSCFLRGDGTQIAVGLTTRSGAALSGETVFDGSGEEWTKREAVLTAEEDAADACLTFRILRAGELDFDMASLMPEDRIGADWPGGGLRRDLTEALAELHPAFLRFPGGCVAEGSWRWDNLYRWKDTIGPAEQRKENWNTWGYMQSYGIGFYEYFCLCEEIGARPLPVVGSGVLCQAREPAEKPMNDAELDAWIGDILDLLEFALDGPETPWGAKRAEMGHPEPFDLHFLAIGNENWANVYFDRYEKIRNRIREVRPEITCIVANGPVAEGSLYYSGRSAILSRFPQDVADEHYYMESNWFLKNTHRYDLYSREPKIFLGEYAAHEPAAGGRRPNNLYSALCEAAYLTGIERNSDVVVMCCYAPLLARQGLDQWTPDLIWFDGTRVARTPNYYIQQMFSASLGDEILQSSMTDELGETVKDTQAGLYHTVSGTEDGRIYVKLVNVSGTEKKIGIRILGREADETDAAGVTMLDGERQAVNSLNSENVAPEKSEIFFRGGSAEIVLPGYSAAVITVP